MLANGILGMQTPAGLIARLAVVALLAAPATAQHLTMPGDPLSGGGAGVADVSLTPANATPMVSDGYALETGPVSSMQSSGSYYNPTLGSHIRARYNTRSYGQQDGMLDLGTMKMMSLDGGLAFFDGQVTVNDEANVGYNVGLGYRWLTLPLLPTSPDDEKIMGISIWSDGQGAGGENFFSQIGTSLEFLGDRIDFRMNGYAPVGPRSRTRDFSVTGSDGFTGNNIGAVLTGTRDTALTIAEAEVAGRIADLDAWVFGGVYGFRGGPYEEVGGKIGLRGYATPDLALSIAITNDDLFDTNAVFSATWFIGRTRVENCPTGVLRDRLREPVIRNDYIALQQSTASATGDLVIGTDGEAVRIVHVDSTAAAGGDGTFENPLNSLDDINSNSLDDDIVLAHGGSSFTGQSATLLDGQTFVGEGGDNIFQVTNLDGNLIDLPETASGAQSGAVPIINAAPGAGVTVALNNTVQNLAFEGGVNAITSAASGSLNANLNNLTISNTTGDGILLTSVVGADTADDDADGDDTETTNLLGDVTIDEVVFSGVAGSDIDIDANTAGAEETRTEAISITNVTSTGNTGAQSIAIRGTTDVTGATTTITDYDYTGGAGGALLFEQTGGVVSVEESDITGGAGPAVFADRNSGSISVGATSTITDVAGNAVVVNSNTGAVTVDADIVTASSVSGGGVTVTSNEATVSLGGDITTNNTPAITLSDAQANVNFSGDIVSNGTGDAITITNAGASTTDSAEATFNGGITNENGRSVVISGGDDAVQFLGELTDNGDGITVASRDEDATVLFGGQATLTTTTSDAVTLTANDDDSSVDFTALDITTTSGDGLVSNSGGELNITGTDNTITTTTGQAIDINGGSSSAGITFESVTVGNGSSGGIEVVNFDGDVTVENSTLTAANSAIVLTDVNNATLNNTTINGSGGPAVDINSTDDTAMNVTFSDLQTPAAVATAIDADQTGTGALGVTVDGGTLNGATGDAVALDGVDGVVDFNDVEIKNGTGRGIAITGGDGSFNFDADVEIENQTGDALTVDGGESNVTYNGTIANTAGRSITVQNKTDGGVSFGAASEVTDSGAGILVDNNTGGDYNFLGSYDLDTATGDAVTVTDNTGSTVTFAELDINTTTGDAFTATGGGTVGVIGTGSTITTTTGAGVTINGMAVENAGVNFDSVTVDGAVTAVDLQDLTGGDVTIGSAASTTDGDGGTFTTTGTAVVATNIGGLNLHNVDIATPAGTSIDLESNNATDMGVTLNNVNTPTDVVFDHTGAGDVAFAFNDSTVDGSITVNHSGAGTFDFDNTDLIVNSNVDINATDGGDLDFFANNLDINTGADVVGLDIELSGTVTDADISITGGGTSIFTQDAAALAIVASGSSKDIRFEMSTSATSDTLRNNSATESLVFTNGGGSILDATISGNRFNNTGAGDDLRLTNAASSTVNLDLTGNVATNANGLVLVNNNAADKFTIVGDTDAAVNADNGGDVTFTGGAAAFTFDSDLDVDPPTN